MFYGVPVVIPRWNPSSQRTVTPAARRRLSRMWIRLVGFLRVSGFKAARMVLKHKDGHVARWAGRLGLISVLRPLFNMRACFSSLLLGLFALQRSLGSASTAGLGLNAHSHNRTRLPVGPVLSTHAHNRTRLSVGSVINAHAQNRTKLHDGGKDPHHRPKRGWVWNQFYVLEEHIGPEPQYVGKVRAAIFMHFGIFMI